MLLEKIGALDKWPFCVSKSPRQDLGGKRSWEICFFLLTRACCADETDDHHRVETTVFEICGEDKVGLLAEVTQLLSHNGCNVRSAAVSHSVHLGGCVDG